MVTSALTEVGVGRVLCGQRVRFLATVLFPHHLTR